MEVFVKAKEKYVTPGLDASILMGDGGVSVLMGAMIGPSVQYYKTNLDKLKAIELAICLAALKATGIKDDMWNEITAGACADELIVGVDAAKVKDSTQSAADDIQSMRDRLAQKVMGWEKVDRVEDWQLYCWHDGTKLVVSYDSWRPDEKIEQAFQIVNRLVAPPYSYEFYMEQKFGECFALFDTENAILEYCATEPKAPLAICLAAIKVLENKEMLL